MPGRGLLVLLAVSFCGVAQAEDRSALLCRLLLAQSGIDVDERELEIRQAETEQEAAAEIFTLVDSLWKNQVVERLIFLGARHSKDVTRLSVARQKSALQRDLAAREQYLALCGPGDHKAGRSVDEAFLGYRQADCDLRGLDVEIAKVELAFREEVRDSVLDLRKNDVATRQEVIRAERDVKLVRQELDSALSRSQTCGRELGARPGG
jgi:hypothetical protein